MQNNRKINPLSRLRQDLRHLTSDLKHTLRAIFGREGIIKGSVYELARKCGKPTCACTRGELHRSMVLSWSHQGKTRLCSVPPERLAQWRKKSGEYQEIRAARARVGVISKRMLVLMDRMEKLRLEVPRP